MALAVAVFDVQSGEIRFEQGGDLFGNVHAAVLAADVLGRVVNPPAEVQAALMCALLGAPLFIALARARRLVQL